MRETRVRPEMSPAARARLTFSADPGSPGERSAVLTSPVVVTRLAVCSLYEKESNSQWHTTRQPRSR
jgi:hypothetical protein